jgi:hypothetical protein
MLLGCVYDSILVTIITLHASPLRIDSLQVHAVLATLATADGIKNRGG